MRMMYEALCKSRHWDEREPRCTPTIEPACWLDSTRIRAFGIHADSRPLLTVDKPRWLRVPLSLPRTHRHTRTSRQSVRPWIDRRRNGRRAVTFVCRQRVSQIRRGLCFASLAHQNQTVTCTYFLDDRLPPPSSDILFPRSCPFRMLAFLRS